jgi:cellulose synthase/poly-beta-1,6-N-acetylglucosamine synthase-like glycosyltransferase
MLVIHIGERRRLRAALASEWPNKPPVSAPLISVIIPHHDDLANLERCLTFLAAQTLPQAQFEVIVADNNSRCGIEESGASAVISPESFRPQFRGLDSRAT